MNRRGFALLATLWVLTALIAVAGLGTGIARLGTLTTRNRVLLARAAWAREACVELLLARYAQDPQTRTLSPVDVGRGTWCRARLEDPSATVNVNQAPPGVLVTLLGMVAGRDGESLARAMIRRRDQGPVLDLAEVTVGVADTVIRDRFARVLTTRGPGVVNVNAAPSDVLRALPGFGAEVVAGILARRAQRPLTSLDDLLQALSPSARAVLGRALPVLGPLITFAPSQLLAIVEAGVSGTAATTRVTLTLVPLPDRLAVVQRETE